MNLLPETWQGGIALPPIGIIRSGRKYEGNSLIFDISVPVQAKVRLPDSQEYTVAKGEHRYEVLLQSHQY